MQSDSDLWVYQFLVFPHEGKEQEEGLYVASLQSRTPDLTDDKGTSDGIKHYRYMHRDKYRSTDLVHTALFHTLSDTGTPRTHACVTATLFSLAFTATWTQTPYVNCGPDKTDAALKYSYTVKKYSFSTLKKYLDLTKQRLPYQTLVAQQKTLEDPIYNCVWCVHYFLYKFHSNIIYWFCSAVHVCDWKRIGTDHFCRCSFHWPSFGMFSFCFCFFGGGGEAEGEHGREGS